MVIPEEIVTGLRTFPAVSPRKASGASMTLAYTEAGSSRRIAFPSTSKIS